MAKYSKKLALEIAEAYGSGRQSVEDVCKAFDIHIDTFYDWKKKKPEFSEAIALYHNYRLSNIADMALSGLALLVTKHEYEEVETQYAMIKGQNGQPDKMIPKGVKKTKKFTMPNAKMIEYALNNRNPMEWKTASKVDVTSNGESIGFANFLMMTKPKNHVVPEEKTDEPEEIETYIPDHRD